MNQHRLLIVYASKYGQTEKVAARIASLLEQRGHAVDVERVETIPSTLRIRDYDGLVVGGSVYGGRHQGHLEAFVKEHRDELANLPTAFFSVSGAAGGDYPEARERAEAQLEDFLKETEWSPDLTSVVGGAFPYTRYGFFLRVMMRIINHRQGAPTDTSRDHEMTDWERVERFADKVAGLLPVRAQPVPDTVPAGGSTHRT